APRRTLSQTTIPPRMKKSAATAASALFCPNAACCSRPSLIAPLFLAVDEPGGLHQRAVALLLAAHPVGVLLAFQRGGVERTLLHELLPLRLGLHLLQDVDVVRHLVLRDAAGHEDAAQHHVLDVEPLLLAGRDVLPGLLVGHFR